MKFQVLQKRTKFSLVFLRQLVSLTLCCQLGFVIDCAASDLTKSEQLGRTIYRMGSAGADKPITARLGGNAASISAETFPCANCHGLEGEGKREGGLSIPSIDAQHLFEQVGKNPALPSYTEKTLAKAITQGYSEKHQPLSDAMPRYALSGDQMSALIAYLHLLGTAADTDPGIADYRVHLATVLPITGGLASTGALLEATLNACVADINYRGDIYGRKIDLTVFDSGSSGQATFEATKHLIKNENYFALVAGYYPEFTQELNQLFMAETMPVIAPLTFDYSVQAPYDENFFLFLPDFSDQARALLDFWFNGLDTLKSPDNAKLTIIARVGEMNLKVADAIKTHAGRHKIEIQSEIIYHTTNPAAERNVILSLQNIQADTLFFLGTADELKALNGYFAERKAKPTLLGLLGMLGPQALNDPGRQVSKLQLAVPFDINTKALQDLTARLDGHRIKLDKPGLQQTACAALDFFAEGLKKTGKHLSRSRLVQSLNNITGYSTGILPPLKFSTNHRFGVRGAFILTKNTQNNSAITISEWVSAEPVY